MRLEFDRSVPRYEQLLRVDAAKTPGRKHQKRKGVKAKEREKRQRASAKAHKDRLMRAYKGQVAAYWRGELEEFPS